MWMTLIDVGLKLVGWLFNRSAVSKKQKEAFLAFYEAYEKMGNASARQRDSVDEQIRDFKKKANEKVIEPDGTLRED
jgi:hypothetical protein